MWKGDNTMTQNLTQICETKVNVMKSAYVPDNLIYCRNVCSGFPTDELPCPNGIYRAVGNVQPLRFGKVAYEMGRKE